ncbi:MULTISPECIES: hypothetical protein [Streptomycetaceae]|uniref:Uncharacterized protein n=1 Tax=Streptantibioticus cattleyicolor (strain ATCC 35852 / DSM 46488 / JCM 4925 / NBRC 14057 / NRRL 8057) TaxID=1003195 RepID=G8WUK6_STREN|nr:MULTISPECIES: hypothetical protein [Streptomycetaceae]AEW95896.1 hypothetical protein SCATT_35250 [Streptantibioticus cattleyicolor NRRL 8057 = DSM 46488]MYS60433.1 hypothetical protein [Streptomyces sp. SID5468]
MSVTWTPALLAAVDDAYDRRNASDGRSRFGAYLRDRCARLHEDGTPLPAEDFAAAVWPIATAPVMSPGYVRLRPDIRAVTPAWSEYGHLTVDVHVPLGRRALVADRAVPGRWRDWDRDLAPGEEPYRYWWEPDGDRPALLTTTVIRLPVDDTWNLPTPAHTGGPGLVADAKSAVAAVADAVNRLAGPVVAALRDEAAPAGRFGRWPCPS